MFGLTLITTAMMATGGTPVARAARSKMSNLAGVLDDDNATTFCFPTILQNASGRKYGRAGLAKINSLGVPQGDVVSSSISQRVRIQCFANSSLTGSYTTRTSAWSTDAGGDITTTTACPSYRPYPGFLRCQIDTSSTKPIVYNGTSCGNGVTSVSPVPATCLGQFTGDTATICSPLWNDTYDQARVFGTDVAANFYEGGKQYYAFGDTFSSAAGADWRSNTLAWGTDFDPSSSALTIADWQKSSGKAVEVIPSAHCSGSNEISKIPGAGFGYSPQVGQHTRVIWFTSVNCSPADSSSYSQFAYQTADGTTFQPGNPKWWAGAGAGDFGPGAIWIDRVNGYIYLFGVKWFGGGVRLARVKLSDNVADMTKYEYYYADRNPVWLRDTLGNGEMAYYATNIIPNSPGLRAEMSVTWNSYANRFMLGGLRWTNGGGDGVTLELWQASAITGPWTRITSADTYAPGYYAPMGSESFLMNGGKDVYFLLSTWNTTDYSNYNVALYKYSISRSALNYCNTSDN
ncbi:MAG: DUF4185 domain-containing protein [Deltaproteobacteria bacterium]|nr:DUF4185 domain-containing protein [Deltaproteobacteria bacterium]